jgi:hypothetical protein
MTSKPLNNNMKVLKKRDCSVDHQIKSRVAVRNVPNKPQNLVKGQKISANGHAMIVGLVPHLADKKNFL